MKILILGGYGTFGGRLAQLLASERRLTLIIAGRSRDKAARFCSTLPAGATTVALALDREGDLESAIAGVSPDLVVDASGPFQSYGRAPYWVVRACIALRIPYLDLADASAFVEGISQFDAAAREAGIFALSGVSSFPVLTAAAIRHLAANVTSLETVRAGIAPSPFAGVGLNVIRAIASYAGQSVAVYREGRVATAYALVETMRYTICPPGKLPLRHIRFSLVDVPDLRVIPAQWPELRSVWVGAGPVPELLHRMLNALAWLVKLRLLTSLSPLARPFHVAINLLRWGEHRGGMFVIVNGRDREGKPTEASWHLLAEGDDGPLIPSMAVAALILRMLAGKMPAAGARPATAELDLADYDVLFAPRDIHTGCRIEPQGDALPLYRRLLGETWSSLPAPWRALHSVTGRTDATGRATVERGRGLLSRLVAACFGLPAAGEDVPLSVSFIANAGHETWQRRFGETAFTSIQTEGRGRWARLLCERFGPVKFGIALVVEGDALLLVLRRWSFLGVPLPMWLAPRSTARETVSEDRFRFDVAISHPLTGPIVRYRGWLRLAAS